jgi:hypothetical protein
MEPQVSLPLSKQPAICPYVEPRESIQAIPFYFYEIRFNIILPSTPRSSKSVFLNLCETAAR